MGVGLCDHHIYQPTSQVSRVLVCRRGEVDDLVVSRPPAQLGIHPALKLGGLLLGLASCLMAPPMLLMVMLLTLVALLRGTGLSLGSQLNGVRPWLPMAAIILLVHTLTTTAAAPLGTPTVAGLLAGLRALLRVSCTVTWLALYTRITSLDDLVSGVRWWLRPLEKLGLSVQNLGLVLAVALGTAPMVLGEGRRIETAVRLRRSGVVGSPGQDGGWSPVRLARRQMDRVYVVVPLMESMGRRVETLSLSLRSRRPDSGLQVAVRPPAAGLALLLAWLVLLVWLGAGMGVSG